MRFEVGNEEVLVLGGTTSNHCVLAIDAFVAWEGQTAVGQPFTSFFSLLHIPQLTDEDLKNLMKNEVNDGT
ncbi:hypothetical protein [Paenisporosarcina sp. NPDC076898]|uniref:hypothetical protein n=1 Tax=unclassified Paenisporosarcina TaxID=2642018 RepID=UPI003D035209